jgi:hypothetical protein
MLRNSDMIMADKETESWWQQLMGVAVVGELAGAELTIIPSLVISVEEFFNRYSEGQILSPNTGTSSEQKYGLNPYEDYDNVGNNPYERFFNPDDLDNRLPHMERVIDIKGKNNYKIYPFSVVAKKGVVNDEFDGQDIVIFHKKGTVSVLDETEIANSKDVGSATLFSAIIEGKKFTFRKEDEDFLDNESNSVWTIAGLCIEGEMKDKQLSPLPHSNHFAFAFLNFYPNSEIYIE